MKTSTKKEEEIMGYFWNEEPLFVKQILDLYGSIYHSWFHPIHGRHRQGSFLVPIGCRNHRWLNHVYCRNLYFPAYFYLEKAMFFQIKSFSL